MNKFFKAEGGFTLVELLVTIAILAVLFGVVTLSLSGVGTDAEATVNDAEYGVVQSAIDIAVADNNIENVVPHTESALDGTELLDDGADVTVTTDDTVPIGNYLRLTNGTSKCQYAWDDTGEITSQTCP